MITTNREIEHYENRSGGEGCIQIERILTPEFMKEQAKMVAKVSIDVHSSIGYHLHSDDRESYYILQGKALYNDNGTEIELGVGACTTTFEGQYHGIKNIGDEPLIILAVILI